MHSRQFRLALILDRQFLYLRGFMIGNSLNLPSPSDRLVKSFGGPSPQVFMTSWNLLISIGHLNCEETIIRIAVALSCLSWGCFCSRNSVSMPGGMLPTQWIL